jgi:N6-L-threonylcarbamoyladenine synthase
VYRSLARTRDDAAGEAFDKVAKLLGLGYPGGPIIERLSEGADERAHHFPRARMKDGSLDFSFSGLKTAVRQKVQQEGFERVAAASGDVPQLARDLAASFQKAVVDVLVNRTVQIAAAEGVRTVLVTGGVACNGRLRREFEIAAREAGFALHIPAPRYTTDNAAMIAAAGFLHFERGDFADLAISADPNLRL